MYKSLYEFIKVSGYKVNIQKSTLFLFNSNKQMIAENF